MHVIYLFTTIYIYTYTHYIIYIYTYYATYYYVISIYTIFFVEELACTSLAMCFLCIASMTSQPTSFRMNENGVSSKNGVKMLKISWVMFENEKRATNIDYPNITQLIGASKNMIKKTKSKTSWDQNSSHGGFLSHGATPSSHPFSIGIFPWK